MLKLNKIPVGTRVQHTVLDERGVVVEPAYHCPANATPVIYDGTDAVWNTLTVKLRVIEESVLAEARAALTTEGA